MTAEIAVLNREAVAMAADSAVTVLTERGQKIFATANKIFALSKFRPVGVMFYANASFVDVPWETVIKMYREHLGELSFPTVAEFGRHFMEYLCSNSSLYPEGSQTRYVESKLRGYFGFLASLLRDAVQARMLKSDGLDEDQLRGILLEIVEAEVARWKKSDGFPTTPENYESILLERYREVTLQVCKDAFERIPIDARLREMLLELSCLVLARFPEGSPSPGFSGVVIAGFGDEEFYPALQSYLVEGVAADVVKWRTDRESAVSPESPAQIVPFAQSGDVATFVEGVEPSYQLAIEGDLGKILKRYPDLVEASLKASGKLAPQEVAQATADIRKVGAKLLQQYGERLTAYRWENFVQPVLEAISVLPKPDLASLAESLVNLTSMRRKFSMDAETVGGPVDVAVISKGDGFIWTKRKHYFSPDLNPHFVSQYHSKEKLP